MAKSGHYTQNPCSRHFECNRDFTTVDKRHGQEGIERGLFSLLATIWVIMASSAGSHTLTVWLQRLTQV